MSGCWRERKEERERAVRELGESVRESRRERTRERVQRMRER